MGVQLNQKRHKQQRQTTNNQAKGAAHHGIQAPPRQVPRYTGPTAGTPQQTMDEENLTLYTPQQPIEVKRLRKPVHREPPRSWTTCARNSSRGLNGLEANLSVCGGRDAGGGVGLTASCALEAAASCATTRFGTGSGGGHRETTSIIDALGGTASGPTAVEV